MMVERVMISRIYRMRTEEIYQITHQNHIFQLRSVMRKQVVRRHSSTELFETPFGGSSVGRRVAERSRREDRCRMCLLCFQGLSAVAERY